jgi:hypothetical protein
VHRGHQQPEPEEVSVVGGREASLFRVPGPMQCPNRLLVALARLLRWRGKVAVTPSLVVHSTALPSAVAAE